MAELSARAARQIADLRRTFEEKDRPEATRSLVAAVLRASERIDRATDDSFPAPRPYPEMAKDGERWIKEGRYWISFNYSNPPTILGVFYDQANLPGRS